MINVLFIDYTIILDVNGNFKQESILTLKDIIVKKIDDVRIVCINMKDDIKIFKYDEIVVFLSQELGLDKSSFDKIETEGNAVELISRWMSRHEVLSFAIVSQQNNEISNAYPNNYVECDMSSFSEKDAKNVDWIMSNFKNKISNEENVWFVSDTHFGHKKIIQYCNRPWNNGKDENNEIIVTDDDVLAMDNEMIKRWNSVVGKNDIVWHLGDFALGGKENIEHVFPQLNGKINLVMGNHDHWKMKYYYDLGFHRVYDRKVIIHDFVILSHAPLMFLNSNSPFFNCFGHVHNSSAYKTWTKSSCCVCVERHDYTPISWKMIKQKYEELNGKVK